MGRNTPRARRLAARPRSPPRQRARAASRRRPPGRDTSFVKRQCYFPDGLGLRRLASRSFGRRTIDLQSSFLLQFQFFFRDVMGKDLYRQTSLLMCTTVILIVVELD